MDPNKHFETFASKLRMEAMLKSFFCGLSVGFLASFATALAFWFTQVNGLWYTIGALVLATVLATLLFYLKKYRPTVMSNARRIDSLGLEERLVTMVEYWEDESHVAIRQRKDAIETLEKVKKEEVTFAFSARMFVVLSVCAVVGIGMTVLSVLGYLGFLPSGSDLIAEVLPNEMDRYIAVTYIVEEGGYIEGTSDQLVLLGDNAEPVKAVADNGYTFVGWDDGYMKPSRNDKAVKKEIVVTAIFELIEEEAEEEEEEGAGVGNNPAPPSENAQPGKGPSSDETFDSPSSLTGGGKYETANQIIDGKTYYREMLDLYKEMLIEYLEENRDKLTQDQIDILEAYINIV